MNSAGDRGWSLQARPWALRAVRLALLLAIALTLRAQHSWLSSRDLAEPVTLEMAREFFPDADSLTHRDVATGGYYVMDDFGDALGIILTTLPKAQNVVGYSGPTNVAIALNPSEEVVGLKLLSSADTANHVDRVEEDESFFEAFQGMKTGKATAPPEIHAVSGATLTSSAIARGILLRLGVGEVSLLFPYPVVLTEAQRAFPEAANLEEDPEMGGRVRVLGESGDLLGYLLRTSPQSDAVIGYKGPTESLVALAPNGKTLHKILVRESYETEEYLAYVTDSTRFLPAFEGWDAHELAELDYEKEGISGVSGATKTSMAVLEGVKRRLQASEEAAGATWHFRVRDFLLVGVVVLGCCMAFTHLRGLPRVRVAYLAFLFIYVGLISGDMLSQTLLVGWANHGIAWQNLPGLAVLGVAAFLIPWSTGKQVYCYQLCPHGAAQQLIAHFRKGPNLRLSPKVTKSLEWLPWLLLGIVVVVVMTGTPLNLASLEPFDAYVITLAGAATIVIAIVGLIASWFVPLAYCRFGCPTGALLKWIRSKGGRDHFGSRDWAVVGLLGLAWLVLLGTRAAG